MATCGTCSGTGSITIRSTCHKCSGTGEVITYDNDGNKKMETCSNCEDGLVYIEQTCHTCRGTGQI